MGEYLPINILFEVVLENVDEEILLRLSHVTHSFRQKALNAIEERYADIQCELLKHANAAEVDRLLLVEAISRTNTRRENEARPCLFCGYNGGGPEPTRYIYTSEQCENYFFAQLALPWVRQNYRTCCLRDFRPLQRKAFFRVWRALSHAERAARRVILDRGFTFNDFFKAMDQCHYDFELSICPPL